MQENKIEHNIQLEESSPLDTYFENVGNHPLLSREEEVELAKAHVPEALAMCAGDQAQASITLLDLIEVQAYVEHLLWHAQIKQISQAICVPAQPWVDAALAVEVAIEHHAILLILTDAGVFSYQQPDGLKAG